MYPGFSLDHRGRLYRIDATTGMPGAKLDLPEVICQTPLERPTIILLHGFNYDPFSSGIRNPHQSVFRTWGDHLQEFNQMLDEPWDIMGFGWYSGNPAWRGWPRSWTAGYLTPYTYAWGLALRAAVVLARLIGWSASDDGKGSPPVMVIAHSLGTRVAVQTLKDVAPDRIARTLFLNGAEYSQNAAVAASYSKSEILNIMVDTDDILSMLGEHFAPGGPFQAVLGRAGILNPSERWLDLKIDDERLIKAAVAALYADISGDDPKDYWDHSFTYRHPPNWKLYRDFLAGRKAVQQLRRALGLS